MSRHRNRVTGQFPATRANRQERSYAPSMSRYRRLLRNMWVTCAVVVVGSAGIGLILANAARESFAIEEDPEINIGVLTTSALLLNAAGVFAALWAATFLAYLITSAMDEGRAEILAVIRAASQDSAQGARSRSAGPGAGSLRTAIGPDPSSAQDTGTHVVEPPRPDSRLSATFEELLGRKLVVRGYTTTEPPQFRRVEGVLTKDAAGQYWIGNSRVDNLRDTKLQIIEG